MKLHQLRYLHEVVKQGLNISAAAEALHTSQPGVSKQIQLLEEELGLQVFIRHGKRLTGVSQPGERIVAMAAKVLFDVDKIKRVGEDYTQGVTGTFTIATTHTQARYKLPHAVKAFMQRYPDVKLQIHQGTPSQVADQVNSGEADIGIATEKISDSEQLKCYPCYEWNRCVVVPHGHALLAEDELTLEKLASYPLVTYDPGFAGSSSVTKVFQEAGLEPNIALTAIDADVIKTYVELGLGIGLVGNMAYDKKRDQHLVRLDASHLFPSSTTNLAVRKDAFLKRYMVDFMQLIAPTLKEQDIKSTFSMLD